MPLLATAQVAELLNELIANGSGARDHSALATLYEQLSARTSPRRSDPGLGEVVSEQLVPVPL